jgi:hypothetical protein
MPDHPAEKPGSPLASAESPTIIAHLNMLQAVVTRLAGNSAQCKTWCVAIVSALFGLAGATKSGRIAVAAIIPILVFGFVDAAYLANERAYRDLYNRIVAKIRDRSYGLTDFGDGTRRCGTLHLGVVVMVGLAGLSRAHRCICAGAVVGTVDINHLNCYIGIYMAARSARERAPVRLGTSTYRRVFAADLLQIRYRAISSSIHRCSRR